MRATKACISLDAIRHNFATLRAQVGDARIMAVVKADAYGHGLVPVARALPQADIFAVASLEEAVELRQAGIDQRILMLEGFFHADELPEIFAQELEVVVHHDAQIEALEALDSGNIQVWLKLDTGMNRLGFRPSEAIEALKRLRACQAVREPVFCMSHFANADEPDEGFAGAQLQDFLDHVEESTPPSGCRWRSIANSAAILTQPDAHLELVRPGLALYGCSPLPGKTGTDHGLIPVMTLESKLFAIKPVNKGESVGYGRSWQAQEDTRVGLVAIGYGDGYPRHARSGTPVWVNGRRVPLAGRISMDMLAVDLGPDSNDRIGDRVVLWGPELPAETVAEHADTISYTLLCGVTRRVYFEYRSRETEAN